MGEVESLLRNVLGEEGFARFSNPVKSDYQKNLERMGWRHVDNVEANNYLIGLDAPLEPLKESLRRMKKDFEERICPGERVEFFRAYGPEGERIPYPCKDRQGDFFSLKNRAIVAVYAKRKPS